MFSKSGIEVTKYEEFARADCENNDDFQVIIKLGIDLFRVGHGWGIRH